MHHRKNYVSEIEVTKIRIKQFSEMIQFFANAATEAGVAVTAHRGHGPTYFAKLTSDQQIQVLTNFSTYAEVAKEMIAANESLASEHRFLWRMIRHMGLRPTNELFSILEKDDVIEVYTVPDFIQVFRNLRFFSNCSYTLDEILCRPYWKLFRREESVTKEIMHTANALVRAKQPKTTIYTIPPHTLEEIDSTSRFICQVENKYISPLFDANKNVFAVVNVMQGTVCESAITESPLLNQPSLERAFFE